MDTPAVVERVALPPQSAGTLRAFSRIGYELPAALADLIDNSIDAEAAKVEITFLRDDDAFTAVTIADNGRGMDRADLLVGMQFAGRTTHRTEDLGTFGTGMKSASFSQCRTMNVISRQDGRTVGGRWSFETIGQDWQCEILDAEGAARTFDQYCMRGRAPTSGTLIVWERLDRLAVGHGPDALDEFVSTMIPRLEAHLGMVFHRFLGGDKLSISITVRHERRSMAVPRTIKPNDPFAYRRSGAPGWPRTLRTGLPNLGEIELTAHVWPAGSADPCFLLGSKRGAEFQGFYFYRNNRLIQCGGWNGVVKSNADLSLSLARVAVELPPGGVDVNVQKSAIQVTAAQGTALKKATDGCINLDDFLDIARAVYRKDKKDEAAKVVPLVPGYGVPAPVRNLAARLMVKNNEADTIDFGWEDLDDDQVFDLNYTEMRLVLNRTYRHLILGDAPATGADAPIVKILLFLLFREDFMLLRYSQKRQDRIDQCNALLLSIVKGL